MADLVPIPISSLPILEDNTGDFWIFASKETEPGIFESVRYNLSDYLKDVFGLLQLERRLTFKIEAPAIDLFIDEQMTIYRIAAVNVSNLAMSVNGGDSVDVGINQDVDINIDTGSIIQFSVNRITTDPAAYLYVYAKVKVDKEL